MQLSDLSRASERASEQETEPERDISAAVNLNVFWKQKHNAENVSEDAGKNYFAKLCRHIART